MLRVSSISFLNTVPLMRGFDPGNPGSPVAMEVWFTKASECADQLRTGIAHVGSNTSASQDW